MFKNYLKIAFRNIKANKVYSFINIAGLAIGMAAFILIVLWIQDELSYDRYHENSENIYRLVSEANVAGKTTSVATASGPMGPRIVEEYPEVLNYVRIVRNRSKALISTEEKKFYESYVFFVDKSIFEVFTFPLSKGDSKSALLNPNSIVITEEMANKYYGNDNPLGKVLNFENEENLIITGVLKNLPQNSHFKFDFLIPLNSKLSRKRNNQDWWVNYSFHTYLQLSDGFPSSELEKKFPDFVERNMKSTLQKAGMEIYPYLQSLTDIHLHSNLEFEIEPNGDITYVYVFSTVALLILLIACVNYVNLSTSQSERRAKEVGVRKVIGAERNQIIKQFLSESFLLTFISLIIGLILVELLLPSFESVSGKIIEFNISNNTFLQLTFIGFVFFISLIAGSYPAFFFSSVNPLKITRGGDSLEVFGKKSFLRKGLIVLQFTISIVLIVGSIVVYKQIDFLKNSKPGFNKEHLVVIPIHSHKLRQNFVSVKNELKTYPKVLSVAATSHVPGEFLTANLYEPEDVSGKKSNLLSLVCSEKDYINTFGLRIKEGRNFSDDFPTDFKKAIILNETAVKNLGWKEPIGKKLKWYVTGEELEVIGVVKDFHLSSLQNKIEPLALQIFPNYFSYFVARIAPSNISSTIEFLENKFLEFDPNHPFEYYFLDSAFDGLYKAEEKFEAIFSLFTLLAIFISCLGLFGLTSFVIERKTKEIGVRKVLGASIPSILSLLTKDFLILVLTANILAIPIAWYAMNSWLQNFAYKIDVQLWMFILAGSLTLVIALATLSYQTIKAALANPIDSLRSE